MGRGVSTASGNVMTAYLHDVIPPGGESYEWDEFIDDLREVIAGQYPSMRPADRWADREDRVILENGNGYVTVSEYMGVVAVCLVPKFPEISRVKLAWCVQQSDRMRRLIHNAYAGHGLTKLATMSNGESMFKTV